MKVTVAGSLFVVSLLILAFAAAPRPAGARQDEAAVRIAVVDLQEVATRSDVGRASQERIRTFFESKRNELDQTARELQQEAATLQNQRSVLSDEAYSAKKNELEQRTLALQQVEQTAERELERMRQQELDSFAKAVGPVVEAIGKEKNFTLILDRRGGVYYFDPKVDITDQIVERLKQSPDSR